MIFVRKFYNEKGQETDAAQATRSADYIADNNWHPIFETIELSVRKRHPEIIGALTPDGSFRAHSADDVENFYRHWRKDRI